MHRITDNCRKLSIFCHGQSLTVQSLTVYNCHGQSLTVHNCHWQSTTVTNSPQLSVTVRDSCGLSVRVVYFFGHVKSVEKTGLIAGNIFQIVAVMSGISLLTLSGKRVKGSTDCLEVPYFKLSTIGGRAFPVAASQIWNSLPETVVSASTLRSFQHHLKTFMSTILYLLAL